jgi:cation diffusion facilitator CzcD-associated flavoprotein CzcO
MTTGARTTTTPPATARHVRVGILGAGFAGLGMAIRLKDEGMDDFVVWERDADVGGTWWANTYPGCQCDIPSHLYSFSFAPNPSGGARTRRRLRSTRTCAASPTTSACGRTSA